MEDLLQLPCGAGNNNSIKAKEQAAKSTHGSAAQQLTVDCHRSPLLMVSIPCVAAVYRVTRTPAYKQVQQSAA